MINKKEDDNDFNYYNGNDGARDRSKSDFDQSGIGEGDPSIIGGIGVVGSSIDQFNESNFSWRSAANNVNKVNLKHFNNNFFFNKNINSIKYSKENFDQINENTSSISINKG